jgi:hypothetical protein
MFKENRLKYECHPKTKSLKEYFSAIGCYEFFQSKYYKYWKQTTEKARKQLYF